MAEKGRFRSFWRRSEPVQPMQEQEVSETNQFATTLGTAFLNMVSSGSGSVAPYTQQELSQMLLYPGLHMEQLRRWARWAYYANGTVAAAIDALPNLHLMEPVTVCRPRGKAQPHEVYRAELDRLKQVLQTIRYKEILRDGIFRDAMDGMYAAYFETRHADTGGRRFLSDTDIYSLTETNGGEAANAMVIPLPIDWVRIIGRRNSCYEIAFDLRYFDTMDEDTRRRCLRGMPKQIQNGWAQYAAGRADGSWLRLDWRKTIVSKIKSGKSELYGIPFAVAALGDVDYAKYFIRTKRSVLDSVNNRIYYETFPEGKDKGTSALTQEQQKNQHNTVKRALTKKTNANGVSFFSLAAGTKMDSLPVDISLLDEENENSIKDDVNKGLGVAASALDGSSSGNYATAEMNMSIVAQKVYAWIEELVAELNKCINCNIIRSEKCVAEFRILPVTFLNRDKMVKNLADLYARGKGSLQAWIAAAGLNPDDYLALMEYELQEDYENRFPVHKTSFTITGKDEAEIVDADLSNPGTASTVGNNANNTPAPSD